MWPITLRRGLADRRFPEIVGLGVGTHDRGIRPRRSDLRRLGRSKWPRRSLDGHTSGRATLFGSPDNARHGEVHDRSSSRGVAALLRLLRATRIGARGPDERAVRAKGLVSIATHSLRTRGRSARRGFVGIRPGGVGSPGPARRRNRRDPLRKWTAGQRIMWPRSRRRDPEAPNDARDGQRLKRTNGSAQRARGRSASPVAYECESRVCRGGVSSFEGRRRSVPEDLCERASTAADAARCSPNSRPSIRSTHPPARTSTLVRDAPARRGRGPPGRTGITWSRRPFHHSALYAREQRPSSCSARTNPPSWVTDHSLSVADLGGSLKVAVASVGSVDG